MDWTGNPGEQDGSRVIKGAKVGDDSPDGIFAFARQLNELPLGHFRDGSTRLTIHFGFKAFCSLFNLFVTQRVTGIVCIRPLHWQIICCCWRRPGQGYNGDDKHCDNQQRAKPLSFH
jgi:hypothetical protein